jgi:NTE family protein
LKVSTGVASSSAFPILLSPVSFLDYSAGCAGHLRNGEWFEKDLSDPERDSAHVNLDAYRDARYTNDLRHGKNPFRVIDHLYFLDGGVADNIGIKTLRSGLTQLYDDVGVLPAINAGRIKKLVVVVVNARADPPNRLYTQSTTPGLLDAIDAVTSIPLDANTANSQTSLTDLLQEVAAAASVDDAKYRGMRIYGITIDFDQLPSDTPEHRQLRDRVKDIATSWTLSTAQLQAIDDAAQTLLLTEPCYAALIHDLDASQTLGPIHAASSCITIKPVKK